MLKPCLHQICIMRRPHIIMIEITPHTHSYRAIKREIIYFEEDVEITYQQLIKDQGI